MTIPIHGTCSWILKGILRQRLVVQGLHSWPNMLSSTKFCTRNIYLDLKQAVPDVSWKKVMYGNLARPRSVFVMWLACQGRLATRERLCRFGLISTDGCCFCTLVETQQHLLFSCATIQAIWIEVLKWLQITHTPGAWDSELQWILQHGRGKGWRARLLKLAFAETIYEVWRYRNDTCFGASVSSIHIGPKIIETIVNRAWLKPALRTHIGRLLIM